MSQVTITTTIAHGNPSDKPLANTALTDSSHKEDLTTHRNIDSGHTGNDLTTNTHNVALVNDIHNPQRTQDLNSNRHGFDNTTYNTTHNTTTHNTQLPDVTIHRTNDYDKTTHNPNVTAAPQTYTTTHYDNTTHNPNLTNVPQTHTTTHYDNTTHNPNLSNVLPQTNTTRHYDNTTNVLPQSNTTTQTHTTTQPLVGPHSHSHEYENLHGKDNGNLLTGTNNVGNANVIRNDVPENLEVDHNRKDNWSTSDNTKNRKINVQDSDHHRHNNDVIIDSTDSKLKKDHDHHHHNLHDTNTKDVIYNTNPTTTDVHTHESNKTTIIHDKNSNVYPNQNLSNDNQHHSHDLNTTSSHNHNQKPIITTDTTSKNKDTIIVDDDIKKRNLTYDTHPTFANDVGTTGLLGNNLGNNLAQDLGPDHLVPRGINKNADWTGHVPDPKHPKHDNLENLPKDTTKKL